MHNADCGCADGGRGLKCGFNTPDLGYGQSLTCYQKVRKNGLSVSGCQMSAPLDYSAKAFFLDNAKLKLQMPYPAGRQHMRFSAGLIIDCST